MVLISSKNIPCIHLLSHIVQYRIIPVCNNRLALNLKGFEIVYYFATEEGTAVFQSGFVDDDGGAFGLDAFHHALNGALAEIVAAGLHGKTIHADDRKL